MVFAYFVFLIPSIETLFLSIILGCLGLGLIGFGCGGKKE